MSPLQPVFTADDGYDGGTVITSQDANAGASVVSTPAVPIAATAAVTPAATDDGVLTSFIAAVAVPQPTPTFAPTRLPVPVVDPAPRYAKADYAGAARALLPRGRVWRAEPGSVQAGLTDGIGAVLARVDAAAVSLLSLPGQATPLLPEWEAALGLPDPCAGPNPTVAQRAGQVLARFAGKGSQSRAFYIGFAKALGFDIAIETFAPFRAGHSRAGQPVNGAGWLFTWRVTILNDAGSFGAAAFRVGAARAGDPLSTASYARTVLGCEFGRLKSAETILLFAN